MSRGGSRRGGDPVGRIRTSGASFRWARQRAGRRETASEAPAGRPRPPRHPVRWPVRTCRTGRARSGPDHLAWPPPPPHCPPAAWNSDWLTTPSPSVSMLWNVADHSDAVIWPSLSLSTESPQSIPLSHCGLCAVATVLAPVPAQAARPSATAAAPRAIASLTIFLPPPVTPARPVQVSYPHCACRPERHSTFVTGGGFHRPVSASALGA